jgi:hypothetical protein
LLSSDRNNFLLTFANYFYTNLGPLDEAATTVRLADETILPYSSTNLVVLKFEVILARNVLGSLTVPMIVVVAIPLIAAK